MWSRFGQSAQFASIWLLLMVLAVWRTDAAPEATDPSSAWPLQDSTPTEAPPTAIKADRPGVRCARPVDVLQDGNIVDTICPSEATARGLTVIDLGDDWLPLIFRGPGGDPTGYGKVYRALAQGRLDTLPKGHRGHRDRYFELFGIFPTFTILRQRLLDDSRHACHDAIDKHALKRLKEKLNPWEDLAKQRSRRWTANHLEPRLEFGVRERGADSIHDLADDPRYGPTYTQYMHVATKVRAVEAAQTHLRCEGLLDPRAETGVLDDVTHAGMSAYQRLHMLVGWTIDPPTAKRMAEDSRQLDYLSLLRGLRERVADATGIIEDGTASTGTGPVAEHHIDTAVFRKAAPHALPHAATDALGRATDAAARALGWTNRKQAAHLLKEREPEAFAARRIAVRLPKPPAYHSSHMTLRAVIDRGEVNFDYPFTARGNRLFPRAKNGPSLVLYARHGATDIPLLRWSTTIGGYKAERTPRGMRMVFKESPAGRRVWRDLVVAPRWIPPSSTSARELMRPTRQGMQLKRDLLGPSYASAFGMVMLTHHRVDRRKGQTFFTDQGIRTHGSVSYGSIEEGESHGCHRLYNHRAVRLASCLLKHRRHERRGTIAFDLRRNYVWRGRSFPVHFDNRGYRYELTPPIEVNVTRGQIVGDYKRPRGSVPLPANVRRRLGG